MAFHFTTGLVAQASQTSISPSDMGSATNYKKVQMLNNEVRRLQDFQIPSHNIYRTSTTWRWPSQGFPANIFATGGPLTIYFTRNQGSGPVKHLRLRVLATSPYAANVVSQYVPLPLMIGTLVFYTPSGEIIQSFTGSDLWLTVCDNASNEKWAFTSKAIQASEDYELGNVVTGGQTLEWFMPITGNWLDSTDFPTFLIGGDCYAVITFLPNSQTLLSAAGTDLTLQDISMDADMVNLTDSEMNNYRSLLQAGPLDFMIPYPKRQNWQYTMNAGQQLQIPLTSIIGDVVWWHLTIRNSYSGEDLYHYNPVTSFQVKDAGGNPITSNQVITDSYNRDVQYPNWWFGEFASNRRVYTWVHSENNAAAALLMNRGIKTGAYGYTGKENLVINCAAQGASEVLTITVTGTPASGTYALQFSTPNGTAVTSNLLYTATAAEIQAALEATNVFQGTCTVTGTAAAGPIVITYTGGYANMPMAARDYTLVAFGTSIATSGGIPIQFSTAVTTPGQWGINSGSSYFIDFYVWTTAILRLGSDGNSASIKMTTT